MATNLRPMTAVDVIRPGTRTWVWNLMVILSAGSLMALFAQISIPLPFTPVPVTGQTLGVLLAGALLGSRRGFAAMAVYLAEGTFGLPVFALGHSGLGTILGPTGGYLLACPLAAYLVGLLAEHRWDRSFWRAAIAMLLGDALIFACGALWLSYFVGLNRAIPLGVVPFIGGDVLKIALAAAVLPSAWRLIGLAYL